MRLISALLAIVVAAVPATAWGVTADESSRAEISFEEGLRLFQAGQTAAACAAFQDSYQLDPRLGTLQNLAICHEKGGQLVVAFGELTELRSKAEAVGRGDRSSVAREHLAALSSRVPRVLLSFEAGVDVTAVEIDGAPRPFRGPIPVESRHHTLTAHAVGRVDAHAEWDATPGVVADVAVVFPEVAPSPRPAPFFEIPPPKPVFLGAFGVAVAGVVVGSIFGALTFVQKADESGHCSGGYCDATGLSADSSAHTSATVSTVSFTLGLAAVAVDAVLLWRSRTTPASTRAQRSALAVSF